MAAVDPRRLPLYVDLAALGEVPDATAALEALDRLEVQRAQAGPGLLLGDGWGVASRRWSERLLLHHACLAAPEAPRWNLAAGDDALRRQAVDEAAEALRASADLGAPFYAVHGGWALELTHDPKDRPVGDAISPVRARDQLCRSLDRLAVLAEARGIALLVETAPNVPAQRPAFADPEAMLAVLDRVGAPHLRLLLDLPALVITARRLAEEPETVVEFLRDRADAMELHHGDAQQARHLPLRETDVELGLARLAGGLAKPVILTLRDLPTAALRDQVALAYEALIPPKPADVVFGPEARA